MPRHRQQRPLRCPFCREEVERPELRFDLYTPEGSLAGACSCGALYVVDDTGRQGGQAVLDLQALAHRVVSLPRDDRWQTMARAALRDDLYAAHAAITEAVVTTTADSVDGEQRVRTWIERDPETVGRARRLLADVLGEDATGLPQLSVGLRAVRTLLTERADTP